FFGYRLSADTDRMAIDAVQKSRSQTLATRRSFHEQSIATTDGEELTAIYCESRFSSGASFPDRRRREKDFSDLYTDWVSALDAYTKEAHMLCRMLAEVNGRADRASEQVSLLYQRRRERDAHAEYFRARKRILRRAGVSST